MGSNIRISRELRVYEGIGIRQVKKWLLALEKRRHRKDGGRNENYHPAAMTPLGFRKFRPYLKYNGMLHIVSLIFLMVYMAFYGPRYPVASAFAVVLTVMNLYCTALQRYHWLTLDQLEARQIQRREARAAARQQRFSPCLSRQGTPEERALMERIRKALEEDAPCVLTSEDGQALESLGACFRRYREGEKPPQPICQRGFPEPRGKHEARILRLCRRMKKASPLMPPLILTETAGLEMTFREIFPTDSSEDMLLRIRLWELACRDFEKRGT